MAHMVSFPKLGGPFLGVLVTRSMIYWGLSWGPLIFGNSHMKYIGIT